MHTKKTKPLTRRHQSYTKVLLYCCFHLPVLSRLFPYNTNTASMDQDLSPDAAVLQHIFDEEIQEHRIFMLLQNWNKCIFKVEADASSTGRYKRPVVVRLESMEECTVSDFALVSETQKAASETLPGLVPLVLQFGSLHSADGCEYCFSVIEFVEGVTLDSAWGELNEASKTAVINDITGALKKLYARGLRDESLQTVLARAADSQGDARASNPSYFGGAHTTVLTTGESLLDAIMKRWRLGEPFYDVEKDDDLKSITIKSRFNDLGSVTIGKHEMDQWLEQAVLCHNDLSPNNIMLKKVAANSLENDVEYRLAAIIDWELAGLYPAAYDTQLLDTYLAGGNRHVSFYLMLKKAMKDLVPRNQAQETLLRAMELISESQHRYLSQTSNIPAQIRIRFFKYCNLTRDQDVFAGWVNKANDLQEYDAAAIQKIEDDVVAETMARWKAQEQAEKEAAEKEAEKGRIEKSEE